VPEWYEELFDQRYLEFYGELQQRGPAREDAEFADRALGLQPGARVLDLGCGFGRHAVALAELGHHVTGLDLSETLLAHAAHLAQEHHVALELVRRDLRQLQGLGPYDACVCLYTVLGYFDDDENAGVLHAVSELLEPRGALLLDVTNPLGLLGHLTGEKWREVPAGVTRERSEYDPLTGRLRAERVLYRSDGRREPIPTSLVRLYAPYELRRLLELAGFETEQLHGGLRDEPFDWRRSPRQVWVARKR
jgi:2-polyprenyl-3-methyl-5-hydroxy-6-metoxy-1,4-benzoquinol methylase